MLKKIILMFDKNSIWIEAHKIRERIKEIPIEYEMLYDVEKNKEILVVSDRQDVCEWCLENKIAVIAYLHEGNKEDDFFNVKYAIEMFEGIDFFYLNRVYQRYHGIPWTILETKRCVLREMTVKDVDELYAIYSDDSITLYLEPLFQDQAQEEEYIANYIDYIYLFFEYGMWVIEEKEKHNIIGRAGIEWKEGGENLEMGYVIAKPYQGKGLAYEVCREIITYVREYITSEPIYIQTESENIASVKLAEKLGFVLEKVEQGKEKIVRRYILRD